VDPIDCLTQHPLQLSFFFWTKRQSGLLFIAIRKRVQDVQKGKRKGKEKKGYTREAGKASSVWFPWSVQQLKRPCLSDVLPVPCFISYHSTCTSGTSLLPCSLHLIRQTESISWTLTSDGKIPRSDCKCRARVQVILLAGSAWEAPHC
jgi:hypothetical protein